MLISDLIVEGDVGPKLQQLKLACKELKIPLKLPNGPYTHDEMVDRVIAAFNAVHQKGGMADVQRLNSNLLSVAALSVLNSTPWYPLHRIGTEVPGTLWPSEMVSQLSGAYSTINTHAEEVRSAAKVYRAVLNVFIDMIDIATNTSPHDEMIYPRSIARANLKSLKVKYEAD